MAKSTAGKIETPWFVNTKEGVYLGKIFKLLRLRDKAVYQSKKTGLSHTEICVLNEIITANCRGERLISTEIAKILRLTRSAVSQTVKDMEERGLVKRLPDAIDKKIAYVELADGVLERYDEILRVSFSFVGKVVEAFGEERFYAMCNDFESFIDTARTVYIQNGKKE